MPTATLTILSDNAAQPPLKSEHGFSAWIETPGANILFDTGAGPAMLHNADALGVDLSKASAIALSHGHYDHAGNLAEILERGRRAPLFLHPDSLRPRFSIHDAPKSIGMPPAACDAVRTAGDARCRWVERPTELATGVWLAGPVPRKTAFEDTGGPFYFDPDGQEPDPILDDLSLCMRTSAGWVVCLGCCHAGVVNTLQHILQALGGTKILTVIGGMHLCHADTERLKRTADAFQVYNVPFLYPCHCTGETATAFLRRRFPYAVRPVSAGLKISFEIDTT